MLVLATMRLERLIVSAALLAFLATPVLAAGHPDMSGSWTIDAAKSDFGQMPVPSDLALRITVEGDKFNVHQTGGGQPDTDLHFDTSGKEMINEVPGAKMTSTHRWDGDALVGEIKVLVGDGTQISFKDRINWSPDGKVMTLSRDISGPMGEAQMKVVMNRKP